MRAILLTLAILLTAFPAAFAQANSATTTKRIPDPKLHFGIVEGKSASIDELLAKPELLIGVPVPGSFLPSARLHFPFCAAALLNDFPTLYSPPAPIRWW